MSYAYTVSVNTNGADLFTFVSLPDQNGKFPTVIYRSPYVDDMENKEIDEIIESYRGFTEKWTEHGYASIVQHCRGRGKSTGYCIPFVDEHKDGIALQEWIRHQPFYNGELFLHGVSYTCAVHLATAPFSDDIKGAVLEVMDCELGRAVYRGGCFKSGLYGCWFVPMYKAKHIKNKNFSDECFKMLPFSSFSEAVFGEKTENFNEILRHPNLEDPFWLSEDSGKYFHNAVKSPNIPILLTTGYYDVFEGGIFSMWNTMDADTKSKSALVVCPYDHGLRKNGHPITIDNAEIGEKFRDYPVEWCDHIRNNTISQISTGKVTYFRLFENGWQTDSFEEGSIKKTVTFGDGTDTYLYNPFDPPRCFKGGLSLNFGGTDFQLPPNSHYSVLSRYSDPFSEKTFVKGKIKVKLTVRSDCDDTAFYIRLMLTKKEGDYALRDDITTLSAVNADYIPNEWQEIEFNLDEHAFMIATDEKLRLDISSAAFPQFIPHTNYKGLFSEQDRARTAHNSVDWSKCEIILPCEY